MGKRILLVLLAAVLGLLVVVQTALLLPRQFDDSYLGALRIKYERLRRVQEPKIVVVGGSSVSFGLNSRALQEQTGYESVNFGLYGTLGTKLMLDLTRGHIGQGDIIILAPELDENSLSLYFNGLACWEACESDWPVLLRVRDRGAMLGSLYDFASQKLGFYRTGKPNPEGVYRCDSFNDEGDMIYDRPASLLVGGYDADSLIEPDASALDEEFIDYVNDYIRRAEKQGATVYWSWPPMNGAALAADEEQIAAFVQKLSQALDCEIISEFSDYVYDPVYFYDSNYHLNNDGVPLHTAQLAADILAALAADGE